MMDNAVEKRGDDFSVGEDVIPACEIEVCHDDKRLTLVVLGDNLEQRAWSHRN